MSRFAAVTIAEWDIDTLRATSRIEGGLSGAINNAAAHEIAAAPEIGFGGPPAVGRSSVGTSASMCTPGARSIKWPRRSSHPHPASRSASFAGPVTRSPTTAWATPFPRLGAPATIWRTVSGLTTETAVISTGTSIPSTLTTRWRMGAADYRAAVDARGLTIELAGPVGDTPWDTALAPAMYEAGRAVHEESLRTDLLAHLRPGSAC